MRSAPVDGAALEYDRTGSGAPVVLLHGWPGDRTDHAEVAALLAGDADVVVPDLRGFGGSDRDPGGDHALAAQVRSVVGLLDELGFPDAVVAGYDIGSRVAQQLAAEHPDRVRAVVVTPPLPGAGRRVLEPQAQREFWYQAFHQLELAERLVDGRPDAVRDYLAHFWNHWSGPGFTPSDARLDHLTARYAAPGRFTASVGWYRGGSGTVARALVEQPPETPLPTPAIVLWPEFDPLFPREWSDRVGEWFGAADVRPVDGVGHFVPVEAPELFAAAVREALAGG
ncbi:alpha/beta fold hydrolase [Pseudonocardia sp. D17]|uniref:alpha/beta fold hydrolase n=1 Tax=Pseudonocardia sp. D17 TaxID=882661 RepID=UPI002B3C25ED|nr:hydrolase [Pseudonocardia sp. D17]